jgi:putative SOS response-associated peptidase YedK
LVTSTETVVLPSGAIRAGATVGTEYEKVVYDRPWPNENSGRADSIHFALEQPPTLTARYNVAPTQKIAVVAPKEDRTKCGLALLKWGLVPYWSQDDKRAHINAKAETVAGLSSFSEPFRHKRCVIPASGFYEWRKFGATKVPHRFRLASGVVMGFAGLWACGPRRTGRS